MEIVAPSESFELDDTGGVGAVRRRFQAMAIAAGLDETRAGDAALIAAELGSNVIKHARHGGAILSTVTHGDQRGVAIAVWDRGPGMNVEACMRDGMSTAGTRGAGLGAVARIATWFDIYALYGRGSAIVATVMPSGARVRAEDQRFSLGAVNVPYPGLQVSGDAWDAHCAGDVATLLVCDGLGHGDGAAEASASVVAAFRARPDDALPAILERAHRAARPTRGAAATLARIDLGARTVTVAGVGNVAAWIAGDVCKQIVTQHGTLGQAAPSHIREERHPLPHGALVVLCSDGLKSRWTLDDLPGLRARHPATIAATMWRDLARGRDDAAVLVAREAAAARPSGAA